MIWNSITDCCSSLLSRLPKAELPFIPAFIMGTLCSMVCIVLLYKKHYETSIWESFIQMLKDIFVTIPKTDHSEFMKCDIDTCVRCKRSENLKYLIVDRWKKIENSNKETEYPDISEGVKELKVLISHKEIKGENVNQGNKKKNLKRNQKPTIFRMKLPSNPFWTDLDCYQMEKELLKVNKKVIQDEFQQIFQAFQNGKSLGWKLNHIPSGHWCIFPIIDQGIVNEENCVKCPNTSTLLGSLPALMKNCVFGNACFSLLFPDSHIEPHYGPTNLRLRCHFGMHIPDGSWLEVDGTQVRWKEGEALVFDDSYEHSAYFGPQREHDKARVVLLLDFWHPSISKREKSILLQLLKPDE